MFWSRRLLATAILGIRVSVETVQATQIFALPSTSSIENSVSDRGRKIKSMERMESLEGHPSQILSNCFFKVAILLGSYLFRIRSRGRYRRSFYWQNHARVQRLYHDRS